MKFSIRDFFSKCDQIRSKLRIGSHLLMKSLIENFVFCSGLKEWLKKQYVHKRFLGYLSVWIFLLWGLLFWLLCGVLQMLCVFYFPQIKKYKLKLVRKVPEVMNKTLTSTWKRVNFKYNWRLEGLNIGEVFLHWCFQEFWQFWILKFYIN